MNPKGKYSKVDFNQYPPAFREAADALWALATTARDEDEQDSQKFVEEISRLSAIVDAETSENIDTTIRNASGTIIRELTDVLLRRAGNPKGALRVMQDVIMEKEQDAMDANELSALDRIQINESKAKICNRWEQAIIIRKTIVDSGCISELRTIIDDSQDHILLMVRLMNELEMHCDNLGHELPVDRYETINLVEVIVYQLKAFNHFTEHQHKKVCDTVRWFRDQLG